MNENKVKVEGQGQEEDMPTVSGCPSLGPKVFPSGADGTEPSTLNSQPSPLNRTNYEDVIADLFHKCNEAFIHAPNQRDSRPGYFKVVVGDLANALASVVPFDNRGRGSLAASDKEETSASDAASCRVYKTPDAAMDVVIDNLTPDLIKRICERHRLKKRMTPAEYFTVAEDCKLTRFKGTNATRLVAVRKGLEGNDDFIYEISVDHENSTAVIECDGVVMYQIKTLGLSYRRCIHAAIQVLRSHLAENDGVHRHHRLIRQRKAEARENA